MKKTIRIDAEAEEETARAIERYEKEREGLGFEFWEELSTAMDGLEDPGPECGPVIGLPPELAFVENCYRASRTRSCSSRETRSYESSP